MVVITADRSTSVPLSRVFIHSSHGSVTWSLPPAGASAGTAVISVPRARPGWSNAWLTLYSANVFPAENDMLLLFTDAPKVSVSLVLLMISL